MERGAWPSDLGGAVSAYRTTLKPEHVLHIKQMTKEKRLFIRQTEGAFTIAFRHDDKKWLLYTGGPGKAGPGGVSVVESKSPDPPW